MRSCYRDFERDSCTTIRWLWLCFSLILFAHFHAVNKICHFYEVGLTIFMWYLMYSMAMPSFALFLIYHFRELDHIFHFYEVGKIFDCFKFIMVFNMFWCLIGLISFALFMMLIRCAIFYDVGNWLLMILVWPLSWGW